MYIYQVNLLMGSKKPPLDYRLDSAMFLTLLDCYCCPEMEMEMEVEMEIETETEVETEVEAETEMEMEMETETEAVSWSRRLCR